MSCPVGVKCIDSECPDEHPDGQHPSLATSGAPVLGHKRGVPEPLAASEDESHSEREEEAQDGDFSEPIRRHSEQSQLKRQLKKQFKKKARLVHEGHGTRQDFVDVFGPNAKPELRLLASNRKDPRLSIWDFQSLVLWCLADVIQPRWMFIKNKPLVEKIIVLQVDGLSPDTLHFSPSLRAHVAALSPAPPPSAVPASESGTLDAPEGDADAGGSSSSAAPAAPIPDPWCTLIPALAPFQASVVNVCVCFLCVPGIVRHALPFT